MNPTDKQIEQIYSRWQLDPLAFVQECIGLDGSVEAHLMSPTLQQKDGLEWIKKYVLVRQKHVKGQPLTEDEEWLASVMGLTITSGHGTGKDGFLSWVLMWLLINFSLSRAMVTGPTSHQLENILWGEFKKWQTFSGDVLRAKMKNPNVKSILEEKLIVQSDRVFVKDDKRDYKGIWEIEGRTANVRGTEDEQAEALSGRHSRFMIMAVDEASGVPRGVFKPIEGALTQELNFAILIGNPTRGSGYFYDTHNHPNMIKRWIRLTWNSEDSPLVDKRKIQEELSYYGRDSFYYRTRRLGLFPKDADNVLIASEWVQRAIENDMEILPEDYKVKGIDVGAGSDATIIATRQGGVVTDITKFTESNHDILFHLILKELSDDEDFQYCFVDPIGVGHGLYSRLAGQVKNVIPADVRAESSDQTCYKKRDEMFWILRKQFQSGLIRIPNIEELVCDLSDIRYENPDSTKGKIKVESKRQMKARGKISPNMADAIALTYYFGTEQYDKRKLKKKKKKDSRIYNWRVI